MANPLDLEPELLPFASPEERQLLRGRALSADDEQALLAELRNALKRWRDSLKPTREQLLQVTHEENRMHARLNGGNQQFWDGLDADWRRKQNPTAEDVFEARNPTPQQSQPPEADDDKTPNYKIPFPTKPPPPDDSLLQAALLRSPQPKSEPPRQDSIPDHPEIPTSGFGDPRPPQAPNAFDVIDAIRNSEIAKFWTPRPDQQEAHKPASQPPKKSPSMGSAEKLTNRKIKVWAEIKKHPGWYVVAFLLSGLPVGFGTIWPSLTHKTIPEWLAANGWPRLVTLVECWLASVAIIAVVIIVRSYLAARRTNAGPDLAGRVECLNVATEWNLEMFHVVEGEDMPVDGDFTMYITVWNESATATTVSGFTLDLSFEGIEYKTKRMPLVGYSVTRVLEHTAFLEGADRTIEEELTEFPSDVEITNTKHQPGWLRFVSRNLPPDAHEKKADFNRTVILELCALDRKGNSHLLYRGNGDFPSCGRVRRTIQVY